MRRIACCRSVQALSLLLLTGISVPAWATVDSLLEANIMTKDPQLDGYCYRKVPVSGEVGILPAILTEASLKPALALRVASYSADPAVIVVGGHSYVNINEAARGPLMVHSYQIDRISDSGVLDYEAELDVSALALHNGADNEGRRRTIEQVKLALLAIAKNLKEASIGGLFRLSLSISGLPDQSDLPGAKVFASTSWPYTAASPLLAAYEQELLEPYCSGFAFAGDLGKADFLGSTVGAVTPEAGGCAVGAASGLPAAGLVTLTLLGLACTCRRRRQRQRLDLR